VGNPKEPSLFLDFFVIFGRRKKKIACPARKKRGEPSLSSNANRAKNGEPRRINRHLYCPKIVSTVSEKEEKEHFLGAY